MHRPITGRLRNVSFVCSPAALKLLQQYRKGESDLIECDGAFYLIATCEVPEAVRYEPDGFTGVDLGIVNIATTSTGYQAAGRGLNRYWAAAPTSTGRAEASGPWCAAQARGAGRAPRRPTNPVGRVSRHVRVP